MTSASQTLIPRFALVAGLAALAAAHADAALLNYSFNSGSATITGSIGSTSFSNATWTMSTTTDTAGLATGSFLSAFPIRYIASTVTLTINATGGPIAVTLLSQVTRPMTAVAALDLSLVSPDTVRLFFGHFTSNGSNGDGAGIIEVQAGLFPVSLVTTGSWIGSSSFNTGSYDTTGGTLAVNIASVANDGVFTISALSAVPLPGAAGLAACGLLATGCRRRR
jgi:hypothetical protein